MAPPTPSGTPADGSNGATAANTLRPPHSSSPTVCLFLKDEALTPMQVEGILSGLDCRTSALLRSCQTACGAYSMLRPSPVAYGHAVHSYPWSAPWQSTMPLRYRSPPISVSPVHVLSPLIAWLRSSDQARFREWDDLIMMVMWTAAKMSVSHRSSSSPSTRPGPSPGRAGHPVHGDGPDLNSVEPNSAGQVQG